jgi:hypothetical protein
LIDGSATTTGLRAIPASVEVNWAGHWLAPEVAEGKIGGRTMPKSIQFIGGPLDGHRQTLSQRNRGLPKSLNLEFTSKTYRVLDKQSSMPNVPASLAVYELKVKDVVPTYYFVPPQQPTADR